MQANTAAPIGGDADLRQVESLCDDLDERVQTAREEQMLLGQLIEKTARTRPYQAQQYRALLMHVQNRYRRLFDLVVRYCR